MMGSIRCFLIEPTGRSVQQLRRSNINDKPAGHWHQAQTILSVIDGVNHVGGMVNWPRDDPRWPVRCERCPYEFTADDMWLVDYWHEMKNPADGRTYTMQDAPLGAMYWAPWFVEHDEFYASAEHKARGGGPHLIVKTPAGEWDIDSKAKNGTNGSGWRRTGEPPNVTVTPSIGFTRDDGSFIYHAFLTDGVLNEC